MEERIALRNKNRFFIIFGIVIMVSIFTTIFLLSENVAVNTSKNTKDGNVQLSIGSLKGEYDVKTLTLDQEPEGKVAIPYEATVEEGTLVLTVDDSDGIVWEKEVSPSTVGSIEFEGSKGTYNISIYTEEAKNVKLNLSPEVSRRATERDWSSISLFDWEEKQIRLTKDEFHQYINWFTENDIYDIDHIRMIDHEVVEATLKDLGEYADFEDSAARIADSHIREAYKASTYYQNQTEPTIRFLNSEDELIVEYDQSSEQRRVEREKEEEEKRDDLGTFTMRDPVTVGNDVITITGGTTVTRRLNDEVYSPNIVVRLGILFENTGTNGTYASTRLFSVKDSWGNELDLYPFDDRLSETVEAGEETHGPLYFVATGKGPYEITYTTSNYKAVWIISDEELEIWSIQ